MLEQKAEQQTNSVIFTPIAEQFPRQVRLNPGESIPLDISLTTFVKPSNIRRGLKRGTISVRSRLAQAGVEVIIANEQLNLQNWGGSKLILNTNEIGRQVRDQQFPRTHELISHPYARTLLQNNTSIIPNWAQEFYERNPNMSDYIVKSSRQRFDTFCTEYFGILPMIIPIDRLFILEPDHEVDLAIGTNLKSDQVIQNYKKLINTWQELSNVMQHYNQSIIKINGMMPDFSIPFSNWGYILGRAPLTHNIYETPATSFGVDIPSTETYFQLLEANADAEKFVPHGGSGAFDPGFNLDHRFPGVAELVLSSEQVKYFHKIGKKLEFEVPFIIMPVKKQDLDLDLNLY
ncbi:MAG: hypothetical protein WCJ58_06715 [bacterium]